MAQLKNMDFPFSSIVFLGSPFHWNVLLVPLRGAHNFVNYKNFLDRKGQSIIMQNTFASSVLSLKPLCCCANKNWPKWMRLRLARYLNNNGDAFARGTSGLSSGNKKEGSLRKSGKPRRSKNCWEVWCLRYLNGHVETSRSLPRNFPGNLARNKIN